MSLRRTLTAAIVLAVFLTAVPSMESAAVPSNVPITTKSRANPCKTVTPQTFNRRVKKLDAVTGKRHHKASRKVCKPIYHRLGHRLRAARKTCTARTLTVTASVFGGRGDDNGIGYRGDRLFNFNDSFAELGMGRALGGLPLHAKRWVNYRSKTVRGTKRDIGGGGAGIGGTVRAIDLHAPLASRLNFPWGIGIVRVSANNCWA